MNILITGAAGYLGSQLTEHLLCRGHNITAFDNMTYGGESLLFAAHHPGLQIVAGDVRDTLEISTYLESTNCLIYLAGIVGEPACETNRDLSWFINCTAAKAVLDTAKDIGVEKIIYVSTCSNYGVSEPNGLADENSELNPLSEYARAKVEVEKYLLDTFPAGHTILRLGTLCGLSGRMRFDLLVNEIARSQALEQEILIYSAEAWRPYLSIRDAVINIGKVAVSDWNYTGSPVFNLVGENLKKSDLVDIVLKHNPTARIEYHSKSPDLRDYRVSGKKFEQQFSATCDDTIESVVLAVSEAVSKRFFPDPMSPKYSAIPLTPLA